MVDPSSKGALGERVDALLRMQIVPTGKPNTMVHKRTLVLDHKLLIAKVEFRSPHPMQGRQIVVEDFHLVSAAGLDGLRGRHEVHEVMEAGREVEGRPVQEARAALGREVDIAEMCVAVHECAELGIALREVLAQRLLHARAVQEVRGQFWPPGLSDHCVPRLDDEFRARVVIVSNP